MNVVRKSMKGVLSMEQYKHDQKVLRKQSQRLTPFLFSELEGVLQYYETTWDYEIVQTLGENASKIYDNWFKLRHIYEDSESMEYPSGDVCSGGEVWVPIKNGNYFKFTFAI